MTAARSWASLDLGDIARSWQALTGPLTAAIAAAQRRAAERADGYLSALARTYGVPRRPAGRLAPGALSGVASDGRDLRSLLYQPAIATLVAVRGGATIAEGRAIGGISLDMIVRTQVADAGRAADQIATVADRTFTGYVRMLNPPSCSRCVVLAGKRYEWNAGFLRHPSCDCVHVPAVEDSADDVRTDPRAYFDSLSPVQQDRAFTKSGAQAIRDGADLRQVVNARRGAYGLTPAGNAKLTAEELAALRGGKQRGHLQRVDAYGRPVFVTTEGTTRRGLAGIRLGARERGIRRKGERNARAPVPRLMPESIYEIAGDDRDEAIRLLKRFGYIL